MNKKIIIISILFVSFIISQFLNSRVFIADTPKINKYFLTDIQISAKNFIAKIFKGQPIEKSTASITQGAVPIPNSLYETINNATLKQISKGVYAGTVNGINIMEIKHDEIDWVEYTYTLKDGRIIKLNIPKGSEPPPREMFE